VEDDDNIRDMLAYALTTAGFSVTALGDGEALQLALARELPSLVILDIMLPGDDGIALLKRLRSVDDYRKLPVIMLTAKGSEMDRVSGLDLGADDYITKPFSVLEVISRVNAILRRSDETRQLREIAIGAISLNDDKRLVQVAGEEITLTYTEFELLRYMMLHEGIVLDRIRLLNQVWGFSYGGVTRTVDMHIKSLRQKLGGGGELIKTVRNVGYKIGG